MKTEFTSTPTQRSLSLADCLKTPGLYVPISPDYITGVVLFVPNVCRNTQPIFWIYPNDPQWEYKMGEQIAEFSTKQLKDTFLPYTGKMEISFPIK